VELIGIEIKVGDQKRFIGKVGIAPKSAHDNIAGRMIFYREARFADTYIPEMNSISVDVAAVDKAAELGAVYFVSYHTDKSAFSVVPIGELQNAPAVDLGERLQYRLRKNRWAHYESDKIRMGFTKNVILAEAVRRLPKTGEELRNEGKQKSLFDLGMK